MADTADTPPLSPMIDVLMALDDVRAKRVKAVSISDFDGPCVVDLAHLGEAGETTVARMVQLRFGSETDANLFLALSLDLLEAPC